MWPDNSGYGGWFQPQYLMPYATMPQQPQQATDWWSTYFGQPQQPQAQQQQRNAPSAWTQQGMNMLKPPPLMPVQQFQPGGGPQQQQFSPDLFATPAPYGTLAPDMMQQDPRIMDPRRRQQMMMQYPRY
jgi:hypothetical protein